MNATTRPTLAALLLLSSTLLVTSAVAQQKRPTPARTQPKPTEAAAPTFETLIPAGSYTIYGEVRNVGQLIQSNTLNEFLEPILKMAGTSKEFRGLLNWFSTHADEVTSSRLLVATWPRNQEVPDILIAIEFASAEEATKFATPLNEALQKVLPPTPASSPEKNDKPATTEKPAITAPAKPNFHLQRFGSLILITEKPLTLKQLKPAGSKPLFDDANFRTARNRLNSEPIFVYVDYKAIKRAEEERRKREEEENKKRAEAATAKLEQALVDQKNTSENPSTPEVIGTENVVANTEMAVGPVVPTRETTNEPRMSTEAANALDAFGLSLFDAESEWPDGIGIALAFDDESFVVRALLVNPPGEKTDVIPFVPILIPGMAVVPEAPNILPADTELFATISLDLPQIYSELTKRHYRPNFFSTLTKDRENVSAINTESPIAALEKQLKINIKDELLPLLGSEIALRLPSSGADFFGVQIRPAFNAGDTVDATTQQSAAANAPVVVISVKDREGMRALMPKLIESFGFKGASSFAQTERREDTELVSYMNLFSYAFVGNFLVLSSDPAATRHVVDCYLKGETLSSDVRYKNYTRWQPRPLHGQLYISPALMESYKTWVEQPSTRLSDQTREYLTRLTVTPQPITYSLANEGFGPLHELHLPKNLVLMAVVGLSSEANPPADLQNERRTIGTLYAIAEAEARYKKEKGAGSYGTLEQLIEAKAIAREMIENTGYRIDITASAESFAVSAVPLEYGKTGRMSYFMDQTRVLRAVDRHGAPATSSDPP